MLTQSARDIRERGDRLFAQKAPLDSLRNEIARHFYVERADFTGPLTLGAEFADHLTTGYPVLIRRALGESIGTMLRPRSKQWFRLQARWQREDHEAKRWLEMAQGVQRRAMLDRQAGFQQATATADHDFAAFGGNVISVEMNRRDNCLLYRTWHLRDVAWSEDAFGQIGEIHRNWNPTAQQLANLFPKGLSPQVEKMLRENKRHDTVRCRHVMIRSADYDGKKYRAPWVSLYLDIDHDHGVEERGSQAVYCIPRWRCLPGSQYAFSPASVVALPDARLLQAQALTLLEAGEKTVNPPMIGSETAVRGDMSLVPGGFTAISSDYEGKLRDVLFPLQIDSKGIPFGIEMADRTAAQIREAFYLNSISLPQFDHQMTATEVGQRVSEYIRNALPIFEPMEHEYNGALCELTFDVLMREGAFGPPADIPAALRGGDVQFTFDSPLSEAIEKEKGAQFLQAQGMAASIAEIDPTALQAINFGEALRDALGGIGAPASWVRSEGEVAAAQQAAQAQQGLATDIAGLQAGADVAATLGQASKAFSEAQV